MSPLPARENDIVLPAAILALGLVGLTLGYAPWALAGVVLAAVVVLITAVLHAKPGLLARRCFGVFMLTLVPAGLQAYVFYPAFLRARNPRRELLPINHAWHLAALARYPALLAILALALALLISSIILAYQHIQQRRAVTPVHWAQVSDHSSQRPLSREQERSASTKPPRASLHARDVSGFWRLD